MNAGHRRFRTEMNLRPREDVLVLGRNLLWRLAQRERHDFHMACAGVASVNAEPSIGVRRRRELNRLRGIERRQEDRQHELNSDIEAGLRVVLWA